MVSQIYISTAAQIQSAMMIQTNNQSNLLISVPFQFQSFLSLTQWRMENGAEEQIITNWDILFISIPQSQKEDFLKFLGVSSQKSCNT